MFTLEILGPAGEEKAQAKGAYARLHYEKAYEPGDTIRLRWDGALPQHIALQLDDAMPCAYAFLIEPEFVFPVPFGEHKIPYSPKSFSGQSHFLMVRTAWPEELTGVRNLSQNPYDHHGNKVLFPHAAANVETRGEAVFAARNAIDGLNANRGHGAWPYASWGINQREDAAWTLLFGRAVWLSTVRITLRADFPHDNWWRQVTLSFPDGTTQTLTLEKTDLPQTFPLSGRPVESVTLCQLCKDTEDPSPFPALAQISFWGTEV